MAKTRPDGSPLTPGERAAERGTPLTPAEVAAERAYWERPYTFQEFPKAMFRFATTTDGRVKLQADGRVELEYHCTVATSGEEAQAKTDGWFDNQADAIAAGKRALQEQEELDREAADRRTIDELKHRYELERQARLEMGESGGGRDLGAHAPGDESTAVKNLTDAKAATRSSERYYTLAEACEALRVDRSTVWRWKQAGKIKTQGTGKRLRVPVSEVVRINSNR